MRPLSLTMTAFGSYAGTTTLPFEKLGHGLYLVTGDTGAGKTTVFNLLTNVYQPTTGTILLNGMDTHGMSTAQVSKAGIGRTFQNIRLFDNLTVEENIMVAMDKSMKYGLFDGLLRLPGYFREEKKAQEKEKTREEEKKKTEGL